MQLKRDQEAEIGFLQSLALRKRDHATNKGAPFEITLSGGATFICHSRESGNPVSSRGSAFRLDPRFRGDDSSAGRMSPLETPMAGSGPGGMWFHRYDALGLAAVVAVGPARQVGLE